MLQSNHADAVQGRRGNGRLEMFPTEQGRLHLCNRANVMQSDVMRRKETRIGLFRCHTHTALP